MLKSSLGSKVCEKQGAQEQWLWQHGVQAGGRGTCCFPLLCCCSWSRVRKGGERGNAELKRSYWHHKAFVLRKKYKAKDWMETEITNVWRTRRKTMSFWGLKKELLWNTGHLLPNSLLVVSLSQKGLIVPETAFWKLQLIFNTQAAMEQLPRATFLPRAHFCFPLLRLPVR